MKNFKNFPGKHASGTPRAVFFLNLLQIQQLRRPSGESVRLGNCRLGFDSESGQTVG